MYNFFEPIENPNDDRDMFCPYCGCTLNKSSYHIKSDSTVKFECKHCGCSGSDLDIDLF